MVLPFVTWRFRVVTSPFRVFCDGALSGCLQRATYERRLVDMRDIMRALRPMRYSRVVDQ